MRSVMTLRACLVAGGAALAVALTGCAGPTTPAAEPDPFHGVQRLDLELPAHPVLTGTDAGLVTTPATPDGDLTW